MPRDRHLRLGILAFVGFFAACGRQEPPAAQEPPAQATPAEAPAAAAPSAPRSALEPETLRVLQLPSDPSPHRVYVHDVNFDSMIDGRSYVVDGDTGEMLGMLSTGYGGAGLVVGPENRALYSIETYYSRGSRGDRTDVVTIYDPSTLAPVAEVEIPPKRAMTMPMTGGNRLTDDGRFLLVFNLTPATSVTVVNVEARKVVGEIETPGCALIYPGPDRRFVMLCGNGSLLEVELDPSGAVERKERSQRFFDPESDLLTEKAVRRGNTWYFISFAGHVYPVNLSEGLDFEEPWPLADEAARAENWLPGGLQPAAMHAGRGHLYVLMHQGGPGSHKDPGSEVWVVNVASRSLVKRLPLAQPATSVQVSQDDEPLMYTIFIAVRGLEIYDGTSGEHVRTVPEIGLTPTLILHP